MRIAPLARDECARLVLASEYHAASGLIASGELAELTLLASNLFQVPISLVSLVERDRQVFLAAHGTNVCETPRDISFCAHAILSMDVFVVLDATLDIRFSGNSMVTKSAGVRFYAGAPLIGPGGHTLGTLCIIDSKPRTMFSAADRSLLAELATLVLGKLETARLEIARSNGYERFHAAAELSDQGAISTETDGTITFWNAGSADIFGYSEKAALGQKLLSLISPATHLAAPSTKAPSDLSELPGVGFVQMSCASADGRDILIELSVAERTEQGVAHLLWLAQDVMVRRAIEDRLFKLAHFDTVTGLPNKSVLMARLEALSLERQAACVLSIDLDGFKEVNESLGHLAGDRLLEEVAERLLSCIRPIDTVARMAGDEFVMLLPGIADPVQAAISADRVIAAIAKDFVFDEKSVNVSASVGFAIHPTFGEVPGDLLSNADLALYQAKAEGRHCRKMFVPALRERAAQRRTQDFELRRAYENDQFELFYQPQVRLSDGALIGAEALLRWNHPTKGLMSPADFLPNLDAGPMAAPVGNWVLDTACAQAARWRLLGAPEFRIGVNLFGAQFRTGNLAARVRTALAQSGLPPDALELEITENIILRHDDELVEPLRELRERGVGVAFDDYGTGYASLSMLKSVPLTRLKLDQTFVRGMGVSEGDDAIIHAVLYLGEKFNLEVIAEDVETETQRTMLMAEGCKAAQGYLFGRPMPAEQFSATYGLVEVQTGRLPRKRLRHG